jgi:hypothetical protein
VDAAIIRDWLSVVLLLVLIASMVLITWSNWKTGRAAARAHSAVEEKVKRDRQEADELKRKRDQEDDDDDWWKRGMPQPV